MDMFLLLTLFCYLALIFVTQGDKVRYVKVEHPNVTYINPKFVGHLNHTVRRYYRWDPVYYYEMHWMALEQMDNRLLLDFYFYEWLTNAYKPTFVEMHFKWCNMLHKDQFFGAGMKEGSNKLAQPCPHPAGEYHLYNMTVPTAAIPKTFPFTRGRIYCNLTRLNERVASIYVDFEIKIKKIKQKNN